MLISLHTCHATESISSEQSLVTRSSSDSWMWTAERFRARLLSEGGGVARGLHNGGWVPFRGIFAALGVCPADRGQRRFAVVFLAAASAGRHVGEGILQFQITCVSDCVVGLLLALSNPHRVAWIRPAAVSNGPHCRNFTEQAEPILQSGL